MALKAAFVFVAPDVDPKVHRQTVVTPQVELTAVAVNNYAEAVGDKAAVGVVRFDNHPGLEFKSGDVLFG